MTNHSDGDLPPPSYEEIPAGADAAAATSSASALPPSFQASSQPSQTTLPPDVQRATAPLRVEKSNASLKGTYLVHLSENKTPPDATFRASNGKLDVTVYLDGAVPRPAVVDARTSNGQIKLVIADRQPGQAVHVSAVSSNASGLVVLPLDFDGVVMISTSNATANISDALRSNSIIVPSLSSDPKHSTRYRITPTPASSSTAAYGEASKASSSAAVDGEGPDFCEVRTSNGKVRAQYLGEETPASEGCIVA